MRTVRLIQPVALPPGTVVEVSNENADRWEAEGWARVLEPGEPVVSNLPDGVSEEDVLAAVDRLAKRAAKGGGA